MKKKVKPKIHLTIESKIISYEGTMDEDKVLKLLKRIKAIQKIKRIADKRIFVFSKPRIIQKLIEPYNYPIKVIIKI